MKAPDTKSTGEGTFHALEWVERHAGALPQLRKLLQEYARASERDFPWRHTSDPYQVLVAEVLLQRTAARSVVVGVWYDLIRRYPDAFALVYSRVQVSLWYR
jgi:adenine-specific DNA glycosylase